MLVSRLLNRRDRRIITLGALAISWLVATAGAATDASAALAIGLAAAGCISLILAKSQHETFVLTSQLLDHAERTDDVLARRDAELRRTEPRVDDLQAWVEDIAQRLGDVERTTSDDSGAISVLHTQLLALEAAAAPRRLHLARPVERFRLGLRDSLHGVRAKPVDS